MEAWSINVPQEARIIYFYLKLHAQTHVLKCGYEGQQHSCLASL